MPPASTSLDSSSSRSVHPPGGLSDQERGLQFSNTGVRVHLPRPVSEVTLRLGTFLGAELQAEDAAGNIVGISSLAGTNSWSDTRVQAPNLAAIVFCEGGGQGAVQRVCILDTA